MSTQHWELFRETVLTDAALQEQLWRETDLDAFVRLVVELGAARGFCITFDDVRVALHASRRDWFAHRSVR